MRGKVFLAPLVLSVIRITPAYAGKSLAVGVLWIHDEDHPRLCGEKFPLSCQAVCPPGSPPPMRGKGVQSSLVLSSCGITPAYAGKSFRHFPLSFIRKDHPRLCGEKHFPHISKYVVCRITPAYAGKSDYDVAKINDGGDHPRLCGEKVSIAFMRHCGSGSPPPMRGKDLMRKGFNPDQRITPAYAVKSF